jgi:hypothetical protein
MITGVRSEHPEYTRLRKRWQRCRDVVAGGDAIKAAGTIYLPRLTKQDDTSYEAYKNRALFFNATWRTIAGLSGMMFRKEPSVEFPETASEMLEDVTMSGLSMTNFAQSLVFDILTCGRVGVLVDYPPETLSDRTRAEAETLNLRPYLKQYAPETIYNWKTEWRTNRTQLVQVRLKETVEIPSGKPYDNPTVEDRYRILELINGTYSVRVYKYEEKTDTDVLLSEFSPLVNGKPLEHIPFYFLNSNDTTPNIDEPPLIDLVDANIAHYRVDADYKHGLHFTGLPTPYISGYTRQEDEADLYIGSTVAWIFPDTQAKASFLEFTGTGLKTLETAQDRLEQQMAILGARMLAADKKSAETAEAAQIHRAGEQSVLAAIANTLSIGLTVALKMMATWAGLDDAKVDISINREFMPESMTPQELTALVSSWQSGAISKETLFTKLQQGDIIQSDTTFEDEQAAIDAEGPPAPLMQQGQPPNEDDDGTTV